MEGTNRIKTVAEIQAQEALALPPPDMVGQVRRICEERALQLVVSTQSP